MYVICDLERIVFFIYRKKLFDCIMLSYVYYNGIIMGLKVICKNIDAIFIIPVCFAITSLSMMLVIPVIKRFFHLFLDNYE